jgi:hypothetical protein
VVVQESQPDTTLDEWKSSNDTLVSMTGQPNVYGSAQIVSVRSGLEALITSGESTSMIEWRDDTDGSRLVIASKTSPPAPGWVELPNPWNNSRLGPGLRYLRAGRHSDATGGGAWTRSLKTSRRPVA